MAFRATNLLSNSAKSPRTDPQPRTPEGEGVSALLPPLRVMWDKINGDTLLVNWHQLQFNLPQPMRIILQSGEFVVTDYEIWKEKIRAYQTEEETKDAAPKNA